MIAAAVAVTLLAVGSSAFFLWAFTRASWRVFDAADAVWEYLHPWFMPVIFCASGLMWAQVLSR